MQDFPKANHGKPFDIVSGPQIHRQTFQLVSGLIC